ncbi:uncharacterized protein LOC128190553 [Crassostrea angulata]|uniref:uncharacterized protein LOC128190553 n=1 Tax=Magallana angulata TaxID=2784310 RepID=UPI0022B0A586|nr:uncharacterized protein LOC128190553 [Crassostrea angulata]
MKISYIYLFQSSVLLFGLSSNHIAESDAEVCDVRYFCTIMSWHPWSSCEQNCSRPASQLRRRFLCFDDLAVSNPKREKVLRYCNISNQIPMMEKRTCEQVNCLKEKVNTSIARENCSSLNDSLELPVWIQRIEFIVLAVVSAIFLMTIVCVCRKCCLFWGCITDDDDDDIDRK